MSKLVPLTGLYLKRRVNGHSQLQSLSLNRFSASVDISMKNISDEDGSTL